jgi:hypothetical protein
VPRFPVLVDCTPQVVGLAVDLDDASMFVKGRS